ncbi:putative ankyrin repeat-containing domain, PGG domain, ankyrin repeat-containing domain superfamily [Helianthus debilis subsp. tardiflorus]
MTMEIETRISLTMQQKQASTYNHPCGDLLDGTREAYLDIVVPLYRALMEGDLEAAKVILQGREHLVRYSISTKKEPPLHVAVMGHSTEFVRYLVSMTSRVDLQLQNGDGNTAFCLAAISGDVGMAKIMVERNSTLPIIRGNNNMMPLYLAAFHGKHEMATFLYDKSNRMMGDEWTNDDRNGVLLKCVQSNIFDVALRIMEDNEELPQDKHEWDVQQVLARTPGAFQPVRRDRLPQFRDIKSLKILDTPNNKLVINELDKAITIINMVISPYIMADATRLLRLLWKRIMKKPKDVIDEILRGPMIEKDKVDTYPSQVLFIAAKMNNTRFLVELIREYPDLIWKTNDDGQTIFHVAVAHRHHDIYNLLYEIGSMKDLITPITDQQGNNILHLVGMKPEKNACEDWVTTAIQMSDEFSWYKEVKGILPPLYREVKNATGETPQELFNKNHENLVSKGMESINESINISMVVSTLVCAIGFSVVFQIPGGFDQNNGFPMFLHNLYFIAFLVLDAISFVYASSSIVHFLSVILSPKHRDMELLLTRWVSGQLALLYSVLLLALACFFLQLFHSIP